MAGLPHIESFAQINGIDAHSFASFTLRNRLSTILDQITKDNKYSIRVEQDLEDLKSNVLHGKIKNLLESGQDLSKWESWLQPFIDKTWFEIPFYFAEAYFYRIIIEKIEYNSTGLDPFLVQKQKDIETNAEQFTDILLNLQIFLSERHGKDQLLKYLLSLSLWGNKSDLSQLYLNRVNTSISNSDYTLVDDTSKIISLFQKKLKRIDVVLDNVGLELFTDLILAEQLISHDLTDKIVLHTKQFPTFVSDATSEDVKILLGFFKKAKNNELEKFANKIKQLINEGRILIQNCEFWNSPLHFYNFSSDLIDKFKSSNLLIFKGDANYRRLFGDRQIPMDMKPDQLSGYLPVSSIAIRILKSEIMIGMETETITTLDEKDKNWLINGKYGIIQLVKT